MNITFEKRGNMLIPYDKEEIEKLNKLKDGIYEVKLSNMDLRTLTQNRAFHLYFTMVAVQLNNSGLYINTLIKEDKYKADIDWSGDLVKNQLWRPIMEAILDKKSTTQLEKAEVDRVYNTLNRYLSGMGVSVPFPNRDKL